MGNELADGWTIASLGDIAELVSGAGFPLHYQGKEGLRYPFFKVGNLGDVESGILLEKAPDTVDDGTAKALRARVIPKGSIVFAKIGMAIRLNRRRLVGVSCCIDNNMMAVIPRSAVIANYLVRFLETVDLIELAQATTVPSLRKKELERIEIPLAPLAEQQRIAAKMEALFSNVRAARQRLTKVPAMLKRFRQSVLAAACSGRLTADWRDAKENVEPAATLISEILRDRNRRFEEAVRKALNERLTPPKKPFNLTRQELTSEVLSALPASWEWVTWNDLTDWITYGFTRPMPHVRTGIPIVSAKNVRDGHLDLDELDHTTSEAFTALSEKDKPRRGEILITKDGAIRGRAALVDTDRQLCITQAVALVRFGGLTAHRPYLLRVIQSHFTQRLIDEESSGIAIPHISITDFGRFPVPLPPLSEQHEIVRRVEVLLGLADAIERRVAAATARAEKLTQAILAKAFRGELVPTEADLARREGREYEPAAVLLERIRAGNDRSERKTNKANSTKARRRTEQPQ